MTFGAMLREERHEPTEVVLAGDGRPISAELSAVVGEGLRASGCNVIDIGPATTACLGFAIEHLHASGGILIGNPGEQPHIVGLQFWISGPTPLSSGGPLESLKRRYQSGKDQPVRRHGDLRRFQADVPYLAAMAEHYHALRPLRVIVDSASSPAVSYLQRLTAATACRITPHHVVQNDFAEPIRREAAHFAVTIDGDGETCRVFDERGHIVPEDRFFGLLIQNVLWNCDKNGEKNSEPIPILFDAAVSSTMDQYVEKLGGRAIRCGTHRAEMAVAMREHQAVLGIGSNGRFWWRHADAVLPDALMAMTQLMILLSRGDEPFSVVLDRDVPMG
jgi:phosphomannomutase/phosphoglucomutase